MHTKHRYDEISNIRGSIERYVYNFALSKEDLTAKIRYEVAKNLCKM